jgi:NADH:ubiquinone oxidoreductase subunit K
MYPDSGSNIDSGVRLSGAGDLISYLPRATAIGLFAPFPDMWFARGSQVGLSGRLLVGLESLLMYAFECLAMYGLWLGRRRLSVWMLFSIALMGTIALGLVVANVGTLYRMRYVFLMLVVVIAAGGAAHALEHFSKKMPEPER